MIKYINNLAYKFIIFLLSCKTRKTKINIQKIDHFINFMNIYAELDTTNSLFFREPETTIDDSESVEIRKYSFPYFCRHNGRSQIRTLRGKQTKSRRITWADIGSTIRHVIKAPQLSRIRAWGVDWYIGTVENHKN